MAGRLTMSLRMLIWVFVYQGCVINSSNQHGNLEEAPPKDLSLDKGSVLGGIKDTSTLLAYSLRIH